MFLFLVAILVANTPIQINVFVSEQGYCGLGWGGVTCGLVDYVDHPER